MTQYILYMIVDYSEPKYIGVVRDHELDKEINEFRATKPPFMVKILGKFTVLFEARDEAIALIQRYHTDLFGWNKTKFGDIEEKPRVRPKGSKNKMSMYEQERFDDYRRQRSEESKRRNQGRLFEGYTYIITADNHHFRNKPESLEKFKETASGRKRYYFPDGTWTWCYSKDSRMAYKNRDKNIPHLEDVPDDYWLKYAPPKVKPKYKQPKNRPWWKYRKKYHERHSS